MRPMEKNESDMLGENVETLPILAMIGTAIIESTESTNPCATNASILRFLSCAGSHRLANDHRDSNAALVVQKSINESLLNTMSTSMYGIAIIALAPNAPLSRAHPAGV